MRPSGYGEKGKEDISDELVRELRELYRPSEPGFGIRALAAHFNLHYNTVKAIVLGKRRRDVDDDDDDAPEGPPAAQPAQASLLFDIDD
jgi:hypothetical protein